MADVALTNSAPISGGNASVAPKAPAHHTARMEGVDFWRGVVLLMIFIDHIPGRTFQYVTFRNFSFADAAEAFIFLSGLVLAYVTSPRITNGSFVTILRRCLRRAGQLYGAHLGLTLSAVALFGLGYLLGGPDSLLTADNRALAFANPLSALSGALTLRYQLGFFNILPVYVILMLLAPILLFLVHRHKIMALAFSLTLYGVARFGYWPPNWEETYSWFINPFAWQLLFTLGMICGEAARGNGIPYSRPMIILSVAVVIVCLVYVVGFRLGAWHGAEPYLDADKSILGSLRLVNFLALAYLLSQWKIGDILVRLPGMAELARLGRQSLSIFSAGSILSALAAIILSFPKIAGNTPVFDTIGTLTILIGTMLLFGLARYLEWRQSKAIGGVSRPLVG